jgi:hypothetical protein
LVLGSNHNSKAADFAVAPFYLTGTKPVSVVVGDVNNDGRLDLVVANSASNNISVLLGNGGGTFPTHVEYSVSPGMTPSSVALGDFNGDNRLDIVVANSATNNISVLLGNGNGTFQTAVSYAAGSGPASVAVGDFNGDKMMDLVVADESGGVVSVLLGNGDGTFNAYVSYDAGPSPTSVAVADFNGDGNLDLAVTNGGSTSNTISVLLGNGNGSFGAPVAYSAGSGFDPVSVVAADFNDDGKIDLAVADNVQIWVNILLGNGDGTFSLKDSQEAGTHPTGVAVGDFNGDGKLDVVVSNNGSDTLTVLSGNGDGTLKWVGNFDGQADLVAVAVGDFNADGKLDAVAVSLGGNSVSVFLGNGDGTVVAPVSYGIGGTPESVAVGAFGSNGVPELVASNGTFGPGCTPGCVSVITGNGNGTFKQFATNYEVDSGPRGLAVGDFNEDGFLDVVVSNSGSENVSVLLNTGSGSFRPAVDYDAGTTPVGVAVGDFNGDSKPDLAVADAGSVGFPSSVSILLGNGDGTFGAAIQYGAGISPTAVAIGDFNGDGKQDLAVTNAGTPGVNSTVSVLLGNGDGTFQPAVSYNVQVDPTSVTVGDFNGDGNPDLAVANAGSKGGQGSVSVLLGNGDGTFQAAVNRTVGANLLSIAAADFDGNGKLDLAVISGGTVGSASGLSIFLGTGGGQFNPPVNYEFGNVADSVAVADLNGDGAPDVAITSANAGVTVLLNPGGTFVTNSSTPNPSYSGETVTFTASVAASVVVLGQPAPTGTVVFEDGQTAIGSASLVSGSAVFSTSMLSQGTHTITAVYSGDTYFNPNTSPLITQLVTAGPAVALAPTTFTFRPQLVGTSSTSQPALLTNTGGATLTITSITVTGANAADFSETNTCGSSVAAGASCTINVTFKPMAKGSRTASVSIADNAAGSPQTISLKGTATVVEVSPASLNFGSVKLGTSSPPQNVSVTNTGTVALSITSIGISGADAGDYSETTTCGTGLGAGASCWISVTFTPRAKNSRVAQLSISDNGGVSPQTVGLAGTGM